VAKLTKNNGLSAVIITYNEEKNIARCLESVKDLADEIIVVDSFSTDATEEICARYHVKFITHAFAGHIEQKNYAAHIATHDWVLSLDADEALTPELKESIRKVLENPQCNAYKMNRLTFYCGRWIRHCGWYPDAKARLWIRHSGAWGGINPHDRWELHDRGEPYGKLKGDLLHYSYYTVSDHLKQIEYFTEIAAKAEAALGKTPSIPKILLGPAVKFIQSYFFRLGFLDGYHGFVICRLSAMASFIKYVKTRMYARQSHGK
jgi:glycosyltransferase involved in cell wall biosynthesis